MRCAAGAGNDHPQTALRRRAREFRRGVRRAMSRKHACFIGNSQLVERLSGMAHRVPVRFAPHNDCYQRFRFSHASSLISHRFAATPFQPRYPTAYWSMDAARSIVLIGMMGAGKSSVGRALEQRTGLARLDTDEAVAAQFGTSISEIFERHGEQKFRDAETEILRKFAPDRATIIVTGGGIVLRPENIDYLRRLGTIVWLNGDEATLFDRASRRNTRPLL